VNNCLVDLTTSKTSLVNGKFCLPNSSYIQYVIYHISLPYLHLEFFSSFRHAVLLIYSSWGVTCQIYMRDTVT